MCKLTEDEAADDERTDRHSDGLLDFKGKVFFAEDVYGDEQEVAYMRMSA